MIYDKQMKVVSKTHTTKTTTKKDVTQIIDIETVKLHNGLDETSELMFLIKDSSIPLENGDIVTIKIDVDKAQTKLE